MEFDGSSHSYAFQIYSKDQNLPEELGDQVNSFQERSLSLCKSMDKLPDSISKFQSLRILKMDSCSNLTEFPVDFGSLISLQELNIVRGVQLKALPIVSRT